MNIVKLKEGAIMAGLGSEDVTPEATQAYLDVINEITKAQSTLKNIEISSVLKTLQQLSRLKYHGLAQVEKRFNDIMRQWALKLDLKKENIDEELLLIPDSFIVQLSKLSKFIEDNRTGSDSTFIDNYMKTRSAWLSYATHNLYENCCNFERTGSYVKGTHPFLSYFRIMGCFLKAEKVNSKKMFTAAQATEVWHTIFREPIETFSSCINNILSKCGKNVVKGDFGDWFYLLDIAETVQKSFENSPELEEIVRLTGKISIQCLKYFSEVLDYIKVNHFIFLFCLIPVLPFLLELFGKNNHTATNKFYCL